VKPIDFLNIIVKTTFEEVDVCSNCESWEVGHLKLVNPNSDVYDF